MRCLKIHYVQSLPSITESAHDEKTLSAVESSDAQHEEHASDHSSDGNITATYPLDGPVFFEIDSGDGQIQQLARGEGEDRLDNNVERKGSLQTDDEFKPIKLDVAKRVSEPMQVHQAEELENVPPSPNSVTHSIESAESYYASEAIEQFALDGDAPEHATRPLTSASSTTLFSVSSSLIHVVIFNESEPTYNDMKASSALTNIAPRTTPDIVTPDSVTGKRGLPSLRQQGYNFDWGHLSARTDASHGLTPEDSAELERLLTKVNFIFLMAVQLSARFGSLLNAGSRGRGDCSKARTPQRQEARKMRAMSLNNIRESMAHRKAAIVT
ncbi:hypothetical protein DFH11DRAFT_1619821 [Phellopilus nigrolimitatus]|nr:hypothetical protein DFH11DRAFT_1619821 [Phellopilus nigrolimitatus]